MTGWTAHAQTGNLSRLHHGNPAVIGDSESLERGCGLKSLEEAHGVVDTLQADLPSSHFSISAIAIATSSTSYYGIAFVPILCGRKVGVALLLRSNGLGTWIFR